jgi:hypothetical protein
MVHWMQVGVLRNHVDDSTNLTSAWRAPNFSREIAKDSWALLVKVCILASEYRIVDLHNDAIDYMIQLFQTTPFPWNLESYMTSTIMHALELLFGTCFLLDEIPFYF